MMEVKAQKNSTNYWDNDFSADVLKGSPMSLQLYFLCNFIRGNKY